MRRQMNADELGDFYRMTGAAIWHVQCLEDVLVTFLVMKLLDQRRSAGDRLAPTEAQEALTLKRRLPLGPLIQACIIENIISLELRSRFETFKADRHWLVHRSMVESGGDLYDEAARDPVFIRILTVQEEAIALKKLVFTDCQSWIVEQGVDLNAMTEHAEEALRKLKGL